MRTPPLNHTRALANPRNGFEMAIAALFLGLNEYAEAHRDQYHSPVGDDGVLGEHWQAIASGLIGLLNGDTGRLDCGTLDGAIRSLATAHGVDLEG